MYTLGNTRNKSTVEKVPWMLLLKNIWMTRLQLKIATSRRRPQKETRWNLSVKPHLPRTFTDVFMNVFEPIELTWCTTVTPTDEKYPFIELKTFFDLRMTCTVSDHGRFFERLE